MSKATAFCLGYRCVNQAVFNSQQPPSVIESDLVDTSPEVLMHTALDPLSPQSQVHKSLSPEVHIVLKRIIMIYGAEAKMTLHLDTV